MKYICIRCGNEYSRLNHYTKHASRKSLCGPIKSLEIPTETNYIIEDSKHECIICDNQRFSDEASLQRHFTSTQHKKKIEEIEKIEKANAERLTMTNLLKTLTDQISRQLSEQISASQNELKQELLAKMDKAIVSKTDKEPSNFNLNNILNVKIENNKDSKDYISDDRKYHLLQRGMNAMPFLVKDVNFDPERPENHNMYISNNKTKIVHVKRNGAWESRKGRELVAEVIHNYDYKFFQSFAENNPDLDIKMYPHASKYYYKYLDITDNPEAQRKIEDEIMDMLYNNREMIIATRKREEAALKQKQAVANSN
jgi:hypothetical protein